MVMISTAGHKIFSCDWGTSNFRLRLIDAETSEVIDEISSAEGISTVFNLWSGSGTDRQQFYADILQKHIAVLAERAGQSLQNIPVIISGMASSTLGIAELNYAGLPFRSDGGSVAHRKINIDGFA